MLNFYNKVSSSKYSIILVLLIYFILILLLNLYHPLYADDWFYSLVWRATDIFDSPKVASIGDIVQSQYAHYFGWGGRVVAHSIAQFFIMLHPLVFDIANSIVMIIFLWIIYKLSNYNKSNNVFLLLFIVIALWLAHPVFPSTVIWLTGSCNYLWCSTIVLLFLYNYCKLYWTDSSSENKKYIYATLFLFGGIVAGWTNENVSVSLLFFITSLIGIMKFGRKKVPLWSYTGLLGAFIGCVFLLLAPGNRVRSILTKEEKGVGDFTFIQVIQERTSMLLDTYISYVLPLSLLFIILSIYLFYRNKKENRMRIFTIPILFFFTAHFAFFAMAGAPIFPPRATFGINTFMIIAIGILYANIEFNNNLLRVANLGVLIIALFYFLYSYSVIYERLQDLKQIYTHREKVIEKSKSEGNYNVVFDDLFTSHKRLDIYDFNKDSNKWENKSYAAYYGLKSVKRISKDDYKLNLYPLDEDGNVIE